MQNEKNLSYGKVELKYIMFSLTKLHCYSYCSSTGMASAAVFPVEFGRLWLWSKEPGSRNSGWWNLHCYDCKFPEMQDYFKWSCGLLGHWQGWRGWHHYGLHGCQPVCGYTIRYILSFISKFIWIIILVDLPFAQWNFPIKLGNCP